jgi:hypothetical protein
VGKKVGKMCYGLFTGDINLFTIVIIQDGNITKTVKPIENAVKKEELE